MAAEEEGGPRLADRSWIDVQKKTFTNWVNDKLKETDRRVEDLETDLDDGVTLIRLLEVLAPGKRIGRYNPRPRMLIQKTQNLAIAFKFMRETEKMPLVNIGPEDITKHSQKLILGLIWALILRYQIAGPVDSTPGDAKKKGDDAKTKQKKQTAKKLLLGWVNSTLPNKSISNFSSDWNDGINLSALVDYCKPGLIPNHASLNPNNGLQNIRNAMNLAEENFGIPQVMLPEDLAVEKPDELSVMTYVSYFCRPDSVGQNALLTWIQEKIPSHNITNFTTDWVDGCALGALTDVVSGGAFPDCEQMSPKQGLENCQQSMDVAEQILGIKKIVSPEEFTSENLDQLSRTSYLTQFRYTSTSQSPASKLTAAGPGIKGDFAGKETNFVVRGRIPNWAKLNISVIAPNGEKIPLKQNAAGNKLVSCQYTPSVSGSYTVEVKLDNEHIPRSPFSVTHSTPSSAGKCLASGAGLSKTNVGKPTVFSVNCEAGGPGYLQAEIQGPTASVVTEIKELKDRDYQVKFTPREVGPHTVSVTWDGNHIANSPFTCLVTDPQKCSASGAGLAGAIMGEPQHITVYTDKAGPGTLSAEAQGPSGPVPVQIRDEGKGKFTCTYIPKETGGHTIDMYWSESPIAGSPFKVYAVLPADASKCVVSNLPEGRLHAGKTYHFDVNTGQAGSGELKALAQGPSMPEKCEVVQKEEGVYAVNFTPGEVGPLKVDVSFGSSPIKGSPFEFTVNDPTKCKVNQAAIENGAYRVKQPIDFRVAAQYAGEGELMATVRGEKGSKALEVKDQGDSTYLVHYTPEEGGPHVIDITYDGEQIPNVPIRIFVEAGSSADNVVVTQPVPSKLGVYTVEHPHDYKVNAAGAGEPALSATGHGARTGLKPKLNITDEGNNRYTVSLVAAEPDTYHVSILWGEEHVPGSPFELAIEDKPRPEKVICSGPHFKVGSTEPVILEVDTENAGAGDLSAICYGNKAGSVPVSIKETKPKNYTLSFVPTTPDIYSLSVLWSGENVKNSPFKVNLIPPNAQKCIVTGPEIPLESGKPVLLHVDATNAGNGKLDAKATGDSGGASDVDIQEVEPNNFDVYLFPRTPEYHTLDVTWGGQPVPGSPFRLNLDTARADAVVLAEPPTTMVEAGQAIGICFDTSKAGRGELSSTCKGTKVGEIPVKVMPRVKEKDRYDIRFTPPEPDIYYVNVLWGGSHIKGSPFTINLMPVDVSKVKVIGPTMPQGVGGPVELMLQTQGAGTGKVTAACIGNKSGNVPVSIQESGQECYQVQFSPPQSDIYTFAVQYGGHDVYGSPFRVNTFPPDASKVKVKEPDRLDVSKPLHYQVDAMNAGCGTLTTACRGERYGAIQLDVNEEGVAHYDLSFTPHHPDMYNLSIQWSGKEVPGSPFKVNLLPAEASKVKVTDVHIPEEAGSGDLVWVDLDCSEAGQGSLRGEAWGDLVGNVPVEAEKKGLRKFRVKFPPKQADMYHFSVWYGDGHVKGSPFNINLVPPQPDRVKLIDTSLPQEAGAPVTFTFDTSKAGKGSLDAKAVGESVGSVPVKVETPYPTEYKVTFVPPRPDAYRVDVTWADKAVKDSPFTIDTRPKVHPELVECGEPKYTTVGEPVELAFDTSRAGPGTLTAKCSGDDSGVVSVDIKKTSEAAYNVTFTPQYGDTYTLSVFYDDTEVKDSPFRINMPQVDEGAIMSTIPESVVEAVIIPEGLLGSAPEEEEASPSNEELTNYIGHPLTLTVDAEDEQDKKGALVATAVGENTGQADIKVTKTPNDSFDVYFNPDKPDRYTIDVKLNDEHIPNSPFVVNYISAVDPNKCYIFGLEDVPPLLQVNEPICFGVDASEAGDGKLTITTDGPSADGSPSKLELKSKEENPQIYNITYIPTAAGQHRVHLLWAGQPIPRSPLSFEVGDASKLQTYPYGKPVAVDISADCKGGDLESYAVHEDTAAKYKVKISKQQKGKFKLSFQPKEPGIYAIHVLLKRKEIPGSPYRIRYAKPPNPKACIVSGLDKEGYVGEPVTFKVDVTEAGSGDLLVRASGPTSGKDSNFTIKDNQDGTYSASYIPIATGDHKFDITWAGMALPDSPYHISVSTRKLETRTALQGKDTVNLVEVNQPVDVRVSNVGKLDVVTAQCTGKDSGVAEVTVEKEEDNSSYRVQFTPTVPDDYTLSVKYNNESVEGSPFHIKVMEKGSLAADTDHLGGPRSDGVEAGKPVNVIVRADGVKNASELSVKTDGPIGPCETTITDGLEGSFGLGFVPTFPGEYLVHASKVDSDAEIPGSPFKVTVISTSDPSKVHITEDDLPIFDKAIPFGRAVKFSISTADAGPGTLNITSRGPGKAEVRVIDNKDGTYTCEITPAIAGKYHIDVLWNDKPISGSPFLLNFKSKKSRVITGLNLEEESFRIDVPHRFKLHCGEIGDGVLEIKIKPPTAADIRLTPLPTGSSYQCEILPKEVGNHEVSVQYNGKHILGSPFNVQFELRGDASKCRMVESSVEHQEEVGDNVTFCISTEGAGKGKLTASVENAETKNQLPAGITQLSENLYNVDFNPGDGSEYLLSVKYDNQHILGSPFKLVFGPLSSNASKCYAEGEGLISCVVNKQSKFVVDITDAGPGNLKVAIDGEEKIEATISTISENKLEVSYLPPKPGTYKITVLWSDVAIPESPFEVTCYNPADPSLLSITNPPTETYIGKPLEFVVNAEKASKDGGTLTVVAQSSKNKNYPGIVEVRPDGNYACVIAFKDTGRYMLHVRWNGADIKGSPFKVKVMSPPRPDLVRASGPGLEDGFVGQEGNFTVETADGGAGTLSVRVHGPKGAFKINMRRHPENERTILVRYDPNIAGLYTVDITWSETHIPGSPFKIDIAEQETSRKTVQAQVEEEDT